MTRKTDNPGPPPGSPNARALDLNELARQTPPLLEGLPENEQGYVLGVRRVLARYSRQEIDADQARAERVLLQFKWLQ